MNEVLRPGRSGDAPSELPVSSPPFGLVYRNGIISSATTFISLSMGLMAGPAVSL
jgi:hypothetical protein